MSKIEVVGDSKTQTNAKEPEYCAAVKLTEIDQTDLRFQVRGQLNQDVVQRYQKRIDTLGMSSFDSQPLLWENPTTKKLTIMDGFHRLRAATDAGLTQIPALLFEGTEAQATVLAMKANLAHGVPLLREERKEACLKVIKACTDKHGQEPANTQLAEIMGVHESTIRDWKEELAKAGRYQMPEKVIGKDGKVQAAKKKQATEPPGKASAPVRKPMAVTEAPAANLSPAAKAPRDSAARKDDPQVQAPAKFPRISDDPDSQGYQDGLRRHNEMNQKLSAASFALDDLIRTHWAEAFDPQGTEEAIKELVEKGKRALDARPKTSGSKAA